MYLFENSIPDFLSVAVRCLIFTMWQDENDPSFYISLVKHVGILASGFHALIVMSGTRPIFQPFFRSV